MGVTPADPRLVATQGAAGLLTIWCRHPSASLVVQENASPEVRADLEDFLHALVPGGPGRHRHDDQGADDMPAHIRAMLTQTQPSIPAQGGAPPLGTWQEIFLDEHRRGAHRRELALHLIGWVRLTRAGRQPVTTGTASDGTPTSARRSASPIVSFASPCRVRGLPLQERPAGRTKAKGPHRCGPFASTAGCRQRRGDARLYIA